MVSEPITADIRRARQRALGYTLRRRAARHPHKIAIIDGDARLTFADFDASTRNECRLDQP